MLTLFRRIMKDCKWKSRKHRNCQCPIAVPGELFVPGGKAFPTVMPFTEGHAEAGHPHS